MNIVSLSSSTGIKIHRTLSFGNVFVLNEIASRLNLNKILGNERQGKLALWQAMAYLIGPKSISPNNLAKSHAIHEILGLRKISELDIEKNLDWLHTKQKDLEEVFGKYKAKSDSICIHSGDEVVEMLASVLLEHLKKEWRCIARTVRSDLSSLALVSIVEVSINGTKSRSLSRPNSTNQKRLDMLGIKLPSLR